MISDRAAQDGGRVSDLDRNPFEQVALAVCRCELVAQSGRKHFRLFKSIGIRGLRDGSRPDLDLVAVVPHGLRDAPAVVEDDLRRHSLFEGRWRDPTNTLDPLVSMITNRRAAHQSAVPLALYSLYFLGQLNERTRRYNRLVTEAEEHRNIFR
jgi:hypothetical protein